MKKFLNKKTVDFTSGDTIKYVVILMALYGIIYGVMYYAIGYWDTIVEFATKLVGRVKSVFNRKSEDTKVEEE